MINKFNNVQKLSMLSLLVTGLMSVQAQASEQYVSVQKMQYDESDERMKIDYTSVSMLKDFGTDFTVSANYSEDVMSGATPVWDFASGASAKLNDYDEQTGLIAFDSEVHDSMDGFNFVNHEMEDKRKAGDISLTWRTPEARDELTVGLSTSKEEDYKSQGFSAQYLHYLDPSKNRSITTGFSMLDNDAENRLKKTWDNAKYYNAQVGITQVFSPTQIASANVFVMHETGELSNPYQTVVRVINTGTADNPNNRLFLAPEKRPDTRQVFGVNVTGNQRLEKTVFEQPVTLHGAVRLYSDDWGQFAQSAKGNVYIGNLDGYGRIMLGTRLMHQSEANFFKDPHANDNYFNQTDFASADERLGEMTTVTAEVGYEKRFAEHWHLITHGAYQKQNSANDLSLKWGSVGLRYDY